LRVDRMPGKKTMPGAKKRERKRPRKVSRHPGEGKGTKLVSMTQKKTKKTGARDARQRKETQKKKTAVQRKGGCTSKKVSRTKPIGLKKKNKK